MFSKTIKFITLALILILSWYLYPQNISNISKSHKNDNKELFYFTEKRNSQDFPKLQYNFNIIVLDLFETKESEINYLKSKNKEVFCSFSIGTLRDWDNDVKKYPKKLIGADYNGWDGETWIDINNEATLYLMKKRIDLSKIKKCTGIEITEAENYLHETAFNISYIDQLTYINEIINFAKSKNLKVIMKGNEYQIGEIKNIDYLINESCQEEDICDRYNDWIESGKYVFNIEFLRPSLPREKNKYFKSYLAGENYNGKIFKKIN